ncbi:MAG: polyribonucleotide nucleotidyltransferase [Flavobacteriales bacterium]|nr:polyribonucleotide nucleotidyltransferase [Flavobacteriales bacterium]
MNLQAIRKTIDFGDGRAITLETGRMARQADGSIVLSMGNTMILATVVSLKEAREGIDFLPLSVDYQEKFAAVGRVPGSFLRREGRLSDYEVLISRLVDRALRPLFPNDYHSETQVYIQLISNDENINPDCLVGLAASAAITITDIPFEGPISEVRVGRVDGKFIINPFRDEMEKSDIDLMVAGTAHDINMVEGEMNGISEKEMVEALKVAHDYIKKQCAAQLELCELLGGRPAPREYNHEDNDEELAAKVKADLYQKLYDVAVTPSDKNARSEAFATVFNSYTEELGEEFMAEKGHLVKKYFGKVKKAAVRNMVLETRQRLDGRKLDEVRPIWTEIGPLPSPHGSALFTRGETQSLTTVTLGSKLDEQLLDSPNLSGYNKFMLHYNFPAFSTGEARPNRGPGRREIGHGNLAMRGLKKMLPDDVGYTVRVVSDILESNGSSSMATVCAGSMALMDAGIKMKAGLSGVAMGMISDEDSGKYAILTDILGDEDHLGDMDFKVVGNENGIYACQMDMKVNGLSYDVLEEALMQAKEGRMHILKEMQKTISTAAEDLKPHAPRLVKFKVEKDKIGAIIGSGGKVIQDIQERTKTTVTIEEIDGFGWVEILSSNRDGLEQAKKIIDGICEEPEVGKVYEGVVKGIMEFGAFVEFLPGKQGLLHISEIKWERLETMDGVLEDGEEVKVKLLDVDKKTGKFKLSRKVLLEKPEGYVEPQRRENRDGDRGDRNDRNRGDRGDRRGGNGNNNRNGGRGGNFKGNNKGNHNRPRPAENDSVG